MNIKGKDVFFYTLTGITLYVVYRMVNFGETVNEAVSGFWEGVTFDPDSMGPGAQLTPGALQSQADWIAKGYLEFVDEGRQPFGYQPTTRITPAGEEYMRQQREKIVTGQVVN